MAETVLGHDPFASKAGGNSATVKPLKLIPGYAKRRLPRRLKVKAKLLPVGRQSGAAVNVMRQEAPSPLIRREIIEEMPTRPAPEMIDEPTAPAAEVRPTLLDDSETTIPITPRSGALASTVGRAISPSFYKAIYSGFKMLGTAEEVDEFGFDKVFEERIKPFFDLLYEKYWRVETSGIENIPESGGALIVANHSGTLPFDAAMIKIAISREQHAARELRPLVEDFVYYLPFLSSLIVRFGGVRACQENAERLLNSGQLVAVFPEGIKGVGKYYSERYKLQRFGRGGFIRLALRTGAPVIPVAVVGAEEIYPIVRRVDWFGKLFGFPYFPITPVFPWLGPLGMLPLPSKWSIRFGEPMNFNKYGARGAEDDILVNRLSEEVRSAIQEMIIDQLKNRKSIWFG
jgi:1-acyl-sn-glycerol-3-phosphate acyltransferase